MGGFAAAHTRLAFSWGRILLVWWGDLVDFVNVTLALRESLRTIPSEDVALADSG